MNALDAIKKSIANTDMIVSPYLGDLQPQELLARPIPGCNHIAWQLGHLIAGENQLLGKAFPGKMPNLPAGFADKYTKETSGSDNPASFHTKEELLRLWKEQREGTFKLIDGLKESELQNPTGLDYAPTVADLLILIGHHALMHAGQWAVVRRKLGRAPLF